MRSPRNSKRVRALLVVAISVCVFVTQVTAAEGNLFARIGSWQGNPALDSRGHSDSRFDYYIVDPICDGSCVTSDYPGYFENYDYFSSGEYGGIWGIDGRDFYIATSTFGQERKTNAFVSDYALGVVG